MESTVTRGSTNESKAESERDVSGDRLAEALRTLQIMRIAEHAKSLVDGMTKEQRRDAAFHGLRSEANDLETTASALILSSDREIREAVTLAYADRNAQTLSKHDKRTFYVDNDIVSDVKRFADTVSQIDRAFAQGGVDVAREAPLHPITKPERPSREGIPVQGAEQRHGDAARAVVSEARLAAPSGRPLPQPPQRRHDTRVIPRNGQ